MVNSALVNRVALAALLVVGTATVTACGSNKKEPVVVSITDPHVAQTKGGSKLITDLYQAVHAAYWRTQGQDLLLASAQVYCVEAGAKVAREDLVSDFKGASSSAIDEFISVAQQDICTTQG